MYQNFVQNVYNSNRFFPTPLLTVITFIAFLHNNNMSPATIVTYITALSFVNKLKGQTDHTTSFIVKKLLVALQRKGRKPDVRMPITVEILHKLVDSLPAVTTSDYQRRLFKAMFLLAFSALLRIGEICPRVIHEKSKVIQFNDCTFFGSKDSVNSAVISMSQCKHNTSQKPFRISIPKFDTAVYCPVRALQSYIFLRGSHPGPLFCFDSLPVTRQVFCNMLRHCVNWSGLNSNLYTSHSFRIGAASSYAARGLTNSQIQRLGRWQSDAFKRYIRIPVLKSNM